MASNKDDSNASQVDPSDDALAGHAAQHEFAAQLDDLINSLSNRFAGVSSEIFAKMDEMSRRLDNLEARLGATKDKPSGSN